MVFVSDVQYLAVVPHFHGFYSSLELCCEGPWSTNTQGDGCDRGAQQSYLGIARNTLSFQTGFNPVNTAVVCAILESISGLEPHQL